MVLASWPKEFGDFMKAEVDRWSPVIKESGAVVD
jgi:hypothetical protein